MNLEFCRSIAMCTNVMSTEVFSFLPCISSVLQLPSTNSLCSGKIPFPVVPVRCVLRLKTCVCSSLFHWYKASEVLFQDAMHFFQLPVLLLLHKPPLLSTFLTLNEIGDNRLFTGLCYHTPTTLGSLYLFFAVKHLAKHLQSSWCVRKACYSPTKAPLM